MGSIYERRVKDIMTKDVVCLGTEATIHEALDLMVENRVAALPVVDARDRCVGIITTTDLIDLTRDVDDDIRHLDVVNPVSNRFIIQNLIRSLGDESVQSFMTESVETVNLDTTLARAAREMLRNRVHHLPVTDDDQRLIGIISTMDILAEFADGAPE